MLLDVNALPPRSSGDSPTCRSLSTAATATQPFGASLQRAHLMLTSVAAKFGLAQPCWLAANLYAAGRSLAVLRFFRRDIRQPGKLRRQRLAHLQQRLLAGGLRSFQHTRRQGCLGRLCRYAKLPRR